MLCHDMLFLLIMHYRIIGKKFSAMISIVCVLRAADQ